MGAETVFVAILRFLQEHQDEFTDVHACSWSELELRG